MIESETISDVKMIGRALSQGWLTDRHDRKVRAVDALFDVIENSDDDKMRIEAFAALVRADAADLKREEVAIRKQVADDEKRLRLLELVKSLPAGTIDRIATRDAGTIDA